MVSEIPEQSARHPLVSFVGEFESLLARVSGAPAWTLTASELTDLLPRLARAANQVASVQLRMLREADRHQVGDPVGAANTAGWWAHQTRTTKPAAHRHVALASRLDDDAHAATSGALADGSVNVEQAAVIVDAVEALPSELVSDSLRADAEEHLVALAEHHDAKDLRVLGR
ncbi:MAG: DUF222 domain-containing protein, partial [Nocardioidaceae bacterium]|nr:DUF222 domain-containing protein [Nocardioidaceae bacterium]